MTLNQALHALNEAAYAAAKAARKAQDPRAVELTRLAIATDNILEQTK